MAPLRSFSVLAALRRPVTEPVFDDRRKAGLLRMELLRTTQVKAVVLKHCKILWQQGRSGTWVASFCQARKAGAIRARLLGEQP